MPLYTIILIVYISCYLFIHSAVPFNIYKHSWLQCNTSSTNCFVNIDVIYSLLKYTNKNECFFIALNGSVTCCCALKYSTLYCIWPSYTGGLVNELMIYTGRSTWLNHQFMFSTILVKPNWQYPFIICKIELSVVYYFPSRKIDIFPN